MSDPVPRILIIDDELHICRNCVKILSKLRYDVKYALSGSGALQMMEEAAFDLVVTDLKMESLGGMEVLRRVKLAHPETMVVVMTGYASISSAVEVMKIGALDYLPKPFTPQEFRAAVNQALEQKALMARNRELMHQAKPLKPVSHQLIGNSPKIKQVVAMIRKVSPTDSTVLVHGESGTGKELVARAIYANSARKGGPFFAVDCGTLSRSLLKSELFGHRKGAFTGAHEDKAGIFKRADGGTVFLDEISNVGADVQSMLLRFIETREILPVGSTQTERINVRLIFATNKNLKDLVGEGSFREDFYYRIFVYPILIPPLRERKADILPISYHFLQKFNESMGRSIIGFEDGAINRLMEYDWPGNVRQLRNVIERTVIFSENQHISAQELPHLGVVDGKDWTDETVPLNNEAFKRMKKEARKKAVDRIEKKFVINALINSGWNVTQAAKKVGLQRTNFQRLMKKHGVKRPRKQDSE